MGATTDDASNLYRALSKLAGDLYSKAERFIFEFLQNADDIPNDSKRVNVKFILLSQHLVILHDGKPFSRRDVTAISNIGDSHDKSGNSSKTGYKGIGFKSVFTDLKCVYIHSGDFSFRYDEGSHDKTKQVPWQIKPIWTNLGSSG
jgi:hypothetical protein